MKQPPLFGWQRGWRLGAAAIIMGVFVYLSFAPKTTLAGLPGSVCLFHEVTGLPCALCGGTRSAKALLQGDYGRALKLNAAAIPAVAALTLASLILIWEAARGRALLNWKEAAYRHRLLFPLGLALLILWWIPQLVGAINGAKSELIDLRNPVARALVERFGHISR